MTSYYQAIMEALEERDGRINELVCLLEQVSGRKELPLHKLRDCMQLLTQVRRCTVVLIEQVAELKEKMNSIRKRGRKASSECPIDFVYHGKSIL